MISNSSYWKDDLLKNAHGLRKRAKQKRWADASFVRVEQAIMLGFYSIRKLVESKLLSDTIASQTIELTAYSWKGKAITRVNSLGFDKLYDLDNGVTVTKDLLFVCHQMVHSYIFLTPLNENGSLDGVIFSSDRERHTALYFLDINRIITLFEFIGNDDPSQTMMVFNNKKQDYDVTNL
jgi:hypothetical protein